MTDREAVQYLKRINFLYTVLKPRPETQIAACTQELEARLAALNAAGFALQFAGDRYMFREPKESC
jgi:hypothetical protein